MQFYSLVPASNDNPTSSLVILNADDDGNVSKGRLDMDSETLESLIDLLVAERQRVAKVLKDGVYA